MTGGYPIGQHSWAAGWLIDDVPPTHGGTIRPARHLEHSTRLASWRVLCDTWIPLLPGPPSATPGKELPPKKSQARNEACQRGIAKLSETLTQVSPDIVVMLGDDQEDLFHEDSMPAVLSLCRAEPFRHQIARGVSTLAWGAAG